MKAKLLSALALLVLSAALAAAWGWQSYQRFLAAPLPIEESTLYHLERGSSFSQLMADLQLRGWLAQPLYFKLYARHSGLGRKLKAGEYQLEPGMTPVRLLQRLTSGRSVQHRFTIVEGTTFSELRAQLLADERLQHALPGLSDEQLLEKLASKAAHPEGLFLAETYQFQRGDSDLDLLVRAHQHLTQVLEDAWQQRTEKNAYRQPYEALIMASIVEKETARADERPRIAGVFVRRLEKGMRLQTDPTVIYGLGETFDGNLTRKDLRRKTPYNTYVIKGLPPTPIAMVGEDAIRAALNPADGEALFFVARGDGSHAFSVTLKEHNRAVRKYQLQRRSDYRSSP
ncbi:endolytic transglycosylase MltG [Marinobacterium sp. CAU 1594]|nr:endolytic transglycosylase MltG [Marinobacterium arenosum]